MCGIAAILLAESDGRAAFPIYDALLMLQHRGQDAAGIITATDKRIYLRKDNGLASQVVDQESMNNLLGRMAVGHVRYPTAGSSTCQEAQPFYTNSPMGLCLAHNGNLNNAKELKRQLHHRHSNTNSDSELLMNVFADELHHLMVKKKVEKPDADLIFTAVAAVQRRARGSYAVVVLIHKVGILAFRDPFGIRPLVFGSRASTKLPGKFSYVVASESAAIDVLGYEIQRDVKAGEAVLFTLDGAMAARICHDSPVLSPCIFEYVYFARPDSVLDGVSVYDARLEMGRQLAKEILRQHPKHAIDCVMPIPDTSRTAALQVAYELKVPYREGFIKNRYIARTFIMPGQQQRIKNVQRKLNPIKRQMVGKSILFVDDSIVRGTTSKQLVAMARRCGAKHVYFASAAPAIRHPNVYGIDMPCRSELIAHNNTEADVAKIIGADWMIYLPLDKLIAAVSSCSEGGKLSKFDTSCFSGEYVTGDIDAAYIKNLEDERSSASMTKKNSGLASGDVIDIHNRRSFNR